MQKYTFYVGAGFTHDGTPIQGGVHSFELLKVEHLLLEKFGAFTKVVGEGAYTSVKKPGLITREPVVIYTIFRDPGDGLYPAGLHEEFVTLCQNITRIARQESILVEWPSQEGELVFNPSL